MRLTLRLLSVSWLGAALAIAASVSGALVDSRCFASSSRNRSSEAGFTSYDRGSAIRFCAPDADSRSFGVVQYDGSLITLDRDANPKVSEFVQQAGKKNAYWVHVTGQMSGHALKVDTIGKSK